MSIKEEIQQKIIEYLDGDYQVTETRTIPNVEDVPFGKVAKKMNLCVFYIDLRNSTDLLFLHHKQTAGKIHKAFLHIISKTVQKFEGKIRSFNGDGLMAFWPANYMEDISKCVRTAMTVKYLVDIEFSSIFEKYEKLDFGIGIDCGDVFIARAGLPRDINNNDLIFMGKCINFAVAIGEQAHSPYHVEISESTYNNLTEEAIIGESNGNKVDMWRDGKVKWKGVDYPTKATSWYWKI